MGHVGNGIMVNDRLIAVGKIKGAHGVRGQVRVQSYTDDPTALARYRPLTDSSGNRMFEATLRGRSHDGDLVLALAGVTTRDEADALRGAELFVPRSALPPTAPGSPG